MVETKTKVLLILAGVTPIGSFFVGLLAQTLGGPVACAVGGSAGLLAVLLLTLRWKRAQAPIFPSRTASLPRR